MIWDSGRYGLFEGMDLDCCWAPEGPALSPLGVRALRAWQDVEGLMWHSSHVTPAYPSFSPRQGAPPSLSPQAALGTCRPLCTSGQCLWAQSWG